MPFTEGAFQRIVAVHFPDDAGGYEPGTVKYTAGFYAGVSSGYIGDVSKPPEEAFYHWSLVSFQTWIWQRPWSDPTGPYQWVSNYFDWYVPWQGGGFSSIENRVMIGMPTTYLEIAAGVVPWVRKEDVGPTLATWGAVGYGHFGLGCKIDIGTFNYYPMGADVLVATATVECDFSMFYYPTSGGRFVPIGFTTELPAAYGTDGSIVPQMELEFIPD